MYKPPQFTRRFDENYSSKSIQDNFTSIQEQIGRIDLIIIYIKMSSIIDDLMFQSPVSIDSIYEYLSDDSLSTISKICKINEESILLAKNQEYLETINKLKFQNQEFVVRSKGFKVGPWIRTVISFLDRYKYWCCTSRQNQILLMKQLVKRQKECSVESSIFLFNGRFNAILSHFLMMDGSSSVKCVSAYKKIIIKNVLHLEQFLHKHLKIGERARTMEQGFSEVNRNLLISQILNMTQTTQQILQDKSEYKFANESLEKQNQHLNFVEKNIIQSQELQKNIKTLFVIFPQFIQSQSLKAHFVDCYQSNSKTLKSLLNIKYPSKRRLEDYAYNNVKAEIINDASNGRLVGMGGCCIINEYRMNLSFIGSLDQENPIPPLEQKVQKIVAVKKPKPDYIGKIDKIAHEKKIVSKLRSSISFFLPKYYNIDKPQLKNCMLMERIVGEQLDFYIESRSSFISFWSKLYIMINVIHGMRHLISYGIVHLDLKPINIIVNKSLITKIIDFGQSYHSDVCPKNYTPGITFPYVAPEVYSHFLNQFTNPQNQLHFSQKQDVFALGIIMSEVFFNDRIFYLTKPKFQEFYSRQSPLDRAFYTFQRSQLFGDDFFLSMISFIIIRCLDPDPERRPRVEWIGIALKLMLNSFGNH